MALLIDEMIHFNFALGVGLACFLIFGNPWLILVAIFFGFLIDVDHWFDYFCLFGFKLNLKKFFSIGTYMKASGKIFVPLHAWELVPVFWLIGFWLGVPGLNWAMSLAYLLHLVWDNFSFPHPPLFYFFSYRWRRKFRFQ